LINGLTSLEKAETSDEIRNIEAVIVLRILNNLGYIGGGEDLQQIIKSPFEEAMIFEVAKKRHKILSEINKALNETHL
jgi:hypothetical protein